MTDPTLEPTPVPPAQPVYATAAPVPGRGLAIAGLVLDFFIPVLGLILSIVAKVQSKRAGVNNTVSTVGVTLGIIFTVAAIIGAIILGIALGAVAAQCASLGSGTHVVNGITYTCGG
jgi:hypothetical protein